MGIRVNGDELELWGSTGDALEVSSTPDVDDEIWFTVSDRDVGKRLTAYLGADERQKLIEWLQATLEGRAP